MGLSGACPAVAGKEEEGADILSSVELCAARAGDSLGVGTNGLLQLVPCPTPRWPDLLVAYMPSERLLFTSKLFSAHVRQGPMLTYPSILSHSTRLNCCCITNA